MHPREAQQLAREAVPGSGEPVLSYLGSGLLNDTYRVERAGRTFSLRVAIPTVQGSSVQDRAWQLEVLREAARQGLAPPLVCGDAERGFLLQEWISGRPWTAPLARRAESIERVAQLLRRVHGLPQPACLASSPARDKRPGAWVEQYQRALAALDGDAAAPLARAAAPLARAAAHRLAILATLPQPAGVICHSDLHLMNLIECPSSEGDAGSLRLLDWEYAHVSEPFWDLAGWAANNVFPDTLLHALLCAYLGRVPQDDEWMRCTHLVWVYDYVCLLWSRLFLQSRHGGAADGTGHPGTGHLGMGRPDIAAQADILTARLQAGLPPEAL